MRRASGPQRKMDWQSGIGIVRGQAWGASTLSLRIPVLEEPVALSDLRAEFTSSYERCSDLLRAPACSLEWPVKSWKKSGPCSAGA